MASISTCPYCGALVRSDEPKCPGCGAANEQYVADTPALDLRPKTISELKEYCAVHELPLKQLRFFIGEDYREPRAYGIYRDVGEFVVYKNKANGSRSLRYQGPDEAHAVRLLYDKLLEQYQKHGDESEKTAALPAGPPKTIEELRAYCDAHGMPLRKMRFFIGEDFKEPRAFGIYRDGNDVVVYKNKDTGERAIRYRGRDEAHAVKELYDKLLDECHRRGIYPEGKPVARSGRTRSAGSSSPAKKKGCFSRAITSPVVIFLLFVILSTIVSGCIDDRAHRSDGYYSTGDGTVYYHYGDNWYYTYDDNDAGYWYPTDGFPESSYEEYSLGDSWDADWGVSDFRESSTWDDLHTSSSDYSDWSNDDSGWNDDDWGSSSSDYSDWDSNDTNWGSDW